MDVVSHLWVWTRLAIPSPLLFLPSSTEFLHNFPAECAPLSKAARREYYKTSGVSSAIQGTSQVSADYIPYISPTLEDSEKDFNSFMGLSRDVLEPLPTVNRAFTHYGL